jgi:hypothetical protein
VLDADVADEAPGGRRIVHRNIAGRRWRCCAALDRGTLSRDFGPNSDRRGQLVERDCHLPVHRFLSDQLVMPSAQVLTKACQAITKLDCSVIALDAVIGVLIGAALRLPSNRPLRAGHRRVRIYASRREGRPAVLRAGHRHNEGDTR